MPQLAANLVFRDAETTRYSPAFVASSNFDRAPFSVRVTSLRPGETRLLFADAKFSVRIRASFLSEIP